MPRSRMIKPDFWDDEKLALATSRDARLIFIGMWNFADDYGVVKGNAIWLRNHVLPYEDSVSTHAFKKWLTELENGRWVIPFLHKEQQYYFITNFLAHQKINRPSQQRNPAPPETLMEDSLNTHGVMDEDSLTKYKQKYKQKQKEKQKYKAQTEQEKKQLTEQFEIFWEAYPKKKSKGQALKSWEKLSKEKILPDIEVIITSLSALKLSSEWQEQRGKYIPHPSTWLNAYGWDDAPQVETINASSTQIHNTQTIGQALNEIQNEENSHG